jgi:hypothetical protein
LLVLLLATIFLQRIGIPVGGFSLPLLLPVGLIIVAWLLLRGTLRPHPARTTLALVLLGLMATAGYLAARSSTEVHLSAFVVVLAVLGPWTLWAAGPPAVAVAGFATTARVFVATMVGLAAVGVAQVTAQFAGVWRAHDYLADLVPATMLLPGYNTWIPLSWDSPIRKAQAFVFLEPSTFSQFVAVAIVLAILRRAPVWQLGVLALGLLSSLSGTGLLLLACGLGLLMLRAPNRIRPVYLLAGGAAAALALLTPVSDVYASRTAELGQETSSLSLRFVLPYEQVHDGLTAEPRRWATGAGPGASDRVLESGRTRAGLDVVYTIPAKAVFEYGLVAAAVLVGFLAMVLLVAPPTVVLPGTLLVWLCVMGGYLATPHTLWAAWLLSPVWSRRA